MQGKGSTGKVEDLKRQQSAEDDPAEDHPSFQGGSLKEGEQI